MSFGFDYDGPSARSTVTPRAPRFTRVGPAPTPETAPGFAERCRVAREELRPMGRPTLLEQFERALAAHQPRRIPPPDRSRVIAAESRRILRELLGR